MRIEYSLFFYILLPALFFSACKPKKTDSPPPPGLTNYGLAFISDRQGPLDLYLYYPGTKKTVNLTNGRTPIAYGPVYDPVSRRIAFSSKSRDNVDIFTIHQNGSGLQNLTQHPAKDGSPAWSPDGKQLAFVSDRTPGSAEIFIMELDSKDVYQLTQNSLYETSPAFSPDGSRIAFCRQLRPDSTDLTRVNGDIFYIQNTDLKERALTDAPEFDCLPDWSPDGSQIAYHSCNDTLCSIWLMDADGSNHRQLTTDSYDNRWPRWSPDGKWIAYTSVRYKQTDIWLIRPDGSEQQVIIRNPGRDEVACWVLLKEP